MKIVDEDSFRIGLASAVAGTVLDLEYMSVSNRQGVPDDYWLASGRHGWLELKFIDKLPSRTSSGILGHRLTGPQRRFLSMVCNEGLPGLVAVGAPMSLVVDGGEGVGVFFFFVKEFDDKGQLTMSQIIDCKHKCMADDGRGLVDCIEYMSDVIAAAVPSPKNQMDLFQKEKPRGKTYKDLAGDVRLGQADQRNKKGHRRNS